MTSAPSGSVPARNAAHGLLGRALSRCRDERATGVLHVQGSPGGAFHLLDGAVVAVESPGAPGSAPCSSAPGASTPTSGTPPTTPPLRGCCRARRSPPGASRHGRVPGAAHDGRSGRGLRRAGRTAGQLRLRPRRAGCPTGRPAAGPGPGVEPEELLVEAGRRLAALASLPRRVSPDRDRVTAVGPPAWADEPLAPVRREILGCANGRRSPGTSRSSSGAGSTRSPWRSPGCAPRASSRPSRLRRRPRSRQRSRSRRPSSRTRRPPSRTRRRRPPSRSPRPPRSRRDPPRRALPSLPGRTSRTRARTRTRRNGSRGVPGAPAAEGLPRREPGASGIREALDAGRPQPGWKGFLRPRGRSRTDSP